MAYGSSRRISPAALPAALLDALQWRLLLLWLLATLLPAAVQALPLWGFLAQQLDHSLLGASLARSVDVGTMADLLAPLRAQRGSLGGAALLSVALMAVLMPWLQGLVVAHGRARRPLELGALLLAGWQEYGRMLRLALWAVLPYGLALLLSVLLWRWQDQRQAQAVLESVVRRDVYVAIVLTGLLWWLALAWLDAARAAFIADPGLRSATRAFIRGGLQLLRRPLWTLLFYLLATLCGLLLAWALGLLRQGLADSAWLWLGNALIGQLIVLALGWSRIARLLALAEVARSLAGARRGARG